MRLPNSAWGWWVASVAAFLIAAVAGFVLSILYNQIRGFDQTLGPPWSLAAIMAAVLPFASRQDKWSLAVVGVVTLGAAAYLVGGQFSEPITGWAFAHNNGLAAYIAIALATAAATVVAGLTLLWIGLRHHGRIRTAG